MRREDLLRRGVEGRDHPWRAAQRREQEIGLHPVELLDVRGGADVSRSEGSHPVDVDELHRAALALAHCEKSAVGGVLADGHEEGHLDPAIVDGLERAPVHPEELVAGGVAGPCEQLILWNRRGGL